MKNWIFRLKDGLFAGAQSAQFVRKIDYPLNACGDNIQGLDRAQQPPQKVATKESKKAAAQRKKAEQARQFKPYAYLNKYGQMVKDRPLVIESKLDKRDNANEQALQELIAHSMVCNGFLSKKYRITLDPEDDSHQAYNIAIHVPDEFVFTEQRRILVEEIIYASAYEKLTVDVASIVWLRSREEGQAPHQQKRPIQA